ncbi:MULTISPECIES: phage tail protein [Citrobacter]|uniref:phage tail protein n=1 Tax=Citrobacter TaxID=544 RepID=UPI00351D6307
MAGFYDDLIDNNDDIKVAGGVPDGVPSPVDTLAVQSPTSTTFETLEPVAEPIDEPSGKHELPNETKEPTEAPVSITAAMLSRPANSDMRARFLGHKGFNDLYREAWALAIIKDPLSFDALLYRANSIDAPIDDEGFEVMQAERLDPNQETLSYGEPEIVKVLDCPDEMDSFLSMNEEDDNTGYQEDSLILRVAAFDISIGSILEWNEELASGEMARRWWYVHRKFNYGTAAVGTLFVCIPCRTFEESVSDGE